MIRRIAFFSMLVLQAAPAFAGPDAVGLFELIARPVTHQRGLAALVQP